MLRWGGIFVDFYRWREGVGPRSQRPPMINLCWGGMESNQVGTAEFVDFARRVGAEPLHVREFRVGRPQQLHASQGQRPHRRRPRSRRMGHLLQRPIAMPNAAATASQQPLGVKYWQIGNETSYDRNGFDLETAAKKTVEFAKAMRQADPAIQLIAWGDSGWAARMAEVAGEHVQFLAFHHMFNPDDDKQPVLRGELYRRDPEATWRPADGGVGHQRPQDPPGARKPGRASLLPLAMTECHFTIPGRNRCDVLSTWAAGVSYARILNNHQRHGDVLKIATAADFCGTRWQNNAVIIPVPKAAQAYLKPVARVMQLYRHHIGSHAIQVGRTPEGLDVTASRRGDTVYLHVANTLRTEVRERDDSD